MRRWNAKTTRRLCRDTSVYLCLGSFVLLVVGPHPVFGDTLAVPNTFTNGEVADADEVNANFDAVKTEVDDNDARIDTLVDQSCPAGEVVTGVDASGSIVCALPESFVIDPTCPAGYHLRTPATVMQDLRAALAAQDSAAYGCNYAPAASIIHDGGLELGRADITGFFMSKSAAFGADPVLVAETIVENLVRELYTITGVANPIGISDGVATYLIENGHIQYSTDHGVIEAL